MSAATPIKLKTVSFQLPGCVQPRAATAPPKIRQQGGPSSRSTSASVSEKRQPVTQHRAALGPPITGGGSSNENNGGPPARVMSPQPDLIADILDTEPSSSPMCSKMEKRAVPSSSYSSPQAVGEDVTAMTEATPSSGSRDMATSSSFSPSSPPVKSKTQHGGKTRAASASAIMQGKVSKAKSIKHHHLHHYHGHHHHHHHHHHSNSSSNSSGGKGSSSNNSSNSSNRIQGSQVTKMAHQLRDQNNSASLDHVRWMKCDVAKMREYLIKIEEEIKLGNRTKSLLDAKVLDLRRCLSVNQQSISSQQKKSYREVCS